MIQPQTRKRTVPVRNIYHMLAYAFADLRTPAFAEVGREEFANAADLCAEILCVALARLVKRGLGRDYVAHAEVISLVRGRVSVAESLRLRARGNADVACNFDEYSLDTPFHQTIKATLQVLLRLSIAPERKQRVKRLLAHLASVSDIPLSQADWNLPLGRQHAAYEFPLHVCRLVADGLILTEDGQVKGLDFFTHEQESAIFERFLVGYFRKEHPGMLVYHGRQVKWAGELDPLLPRMITDVYVRSGKRVLIIDAKWYTQTLGHARADAGMRADSGMGKLRSSHLYQICSYVRNEAASEPESQVSGLLLYGRGTECSTLNARFEIGGHQIGAQAIDMTQEFPKIRAELDAIIDEYFL